MVARCTEGAPYFEGATPQATSSARVAMGETFHRKNPVPERHRVNGIVTRTFGLLQHKLSAPLSQPFVADHMGGPRLTGPIYRVDGKTASCSDVFGGLFSSDKSERGVDRTCLEAINNGREVQPCFLPDQRVDYTSVSGLDRFSQKMDGARLVEVVSNKRRTQCASLPRLSATFTSALSRNPRGGETPDGIRAPRSSTGAVDNLWVAANVGGLALIVKRIVGPVICKGFA
jgi:hypothetical protein